MSMPFPVSIPSGTTISEWYALHSGGNTVRIPIVTPIVGPCSIPKQKRMANNAE